MGFSQDILRKGRINCRVSIDVISDSIPCLKALSTRDPEAFRAELRGFKGDMWCTNRNPEATWQLSNLQLGSLNLQHGHVGAPNMVMGESLNNAGLIYLLADGKNGSRFNGQAISKANAVIFEAGRDFVLSHDYPHDWFTIRSTSPFSSPSEDHSFLDDHSRVRPLLQRVVSIMNTASVAPGFAESPAAKVAAQILAAGIKNLIAGATHHQAAVLRRGRPPRLRRIILQTCHDYLCAYDQTPISVRELAEACNVSVRTLQTVFNDYYGFGPSKYLQYRQLYRVHRDLKGADPESGRVSHILLDHGVWNFSHFCRRYKELFSETPHQTIGRS